MKKIITVRAIERSNKGNPVIVTMEDEKFYINKNVVLNPVVGMEYTVDYDIKPYNSKNYNWISQAVSQAGTTHEVETKTSSEKAETTDIDLRLMCLSYAKDLVVSDDVEIGELQSFAAELAEWVKTGILSLPEIEF